MILVCLKHGDLAVVNIIIDDGRLSAIIAVGDPACDLTIACTYFSDKAHEVFMQKQIIDSAIG